MILLRASAQAPRFFVIYDSQLPLASSRFGRDSIKYRVGKTHCQGHQTQVREFLFFWELMRLWFPLAGFAFRGVVLYLFASWCELTTATKRMITHVCKRTRRQHQGLNIPFDTLRTSTQGRDHSTTGSLIMCKGCCGALYRLQVVRRAFHAWDDGVGLEHRHLWCAAYPGSIDAFRREPLLP